LLIRSLISTLLTPPAANLVLILLGLLLLFRFRRTGIALCVVGTLSLWLLSTAVVSTTLARALEVYPALDSKNLPDGVPLAIVVAGAGHYDLAAEYQVSAPDDGALERLHYAAFLHRQTDLPLLLTGGPMNRRQDIHSEVLASSLRDQFDIEARWLETSSATTWQNALFSAEILLPQQIDTIVLVTHAYHMQRAVLLFEWAGFTVIPAPTRLSPGYPWQQWRFWLPGASDLDLSHKVFHEVLGLLWYRFRSPVDSSMEREVRLPVF